MSHAGEVRTQHRFRKATGRSQDGARPPCSLDKTVSSPLWIKKETKRHRSGQRLTRLSGRHYREKKTLETEGSLSPENFSDELLVSFWSMRSEASRSMANTHFAIGQTQ